MFAFGSWQGTAGFQRLELTVANVGTTGYRLLLQGTAGSQRLELYDSHRATDWKCLKLFFSFIFHLGFHL